MFNSIFIPMIIVCLTFVSAEAKEDSMYLPMHTRYNKISKNKAQSLLFLAQGWSKKDAYLDYLQESMADDGFYNFQGGFYHEPGSAVVGYFLVNPYTGDIWNSDGCTRIMTLALEKRQAEIKRRLRLPPKLYAKWHDVQPGCIIGGR